MRETDDRIRWAPRLRPAVLGRLYESDARGFRNLELCDEVGCALLARCETFALVRARRLRCPRCQAVFEVSREGASRCTTQGCDFKTSFVDYQRSVRNHYAWPGGAGDAFDGFYRRYPAARDYEEKLLLIDQLIHGFHVDAQRAPAKSVASKLLEGNKKDVVRFLDRLSARDPRAKEDWRRTIAATIDARVLSRLG